MKNNCVVLLQEYGAGRMLTGEVKQRLVVQLAHFGVSNGDVFGSNPPSPNNQSIKNKKLKGKKKKKFLLISLSWIDFKWLLKCVLSIG